MAQNKGEFGAASLFLKNDLHSNVKVGDFVEFQVLPGFKQLRNFKLERVSEVEGVFGRSLLYALAEDSKSENSLELGQESKNGEDQVVGL